MITGIPRYSTLKRRSSPGALPRRKLHREELLINQHDVAVGNVDSTGWLLVFGVEASGTPITVQFTTHSSSSVSKGSWDGPSWRLKWL